MPRTSHHQRIARALAKVTDLTYQQALGKVTAAAAAGLLPSPLDKAGVARAVATLASGRIVSAVANQGVVATVADIFSAPRGLVLVIGPPATGRTTLMYETAVRRAEQGNQVIIIEPMIERILDRDHSNGGTVLQMEHGLGGAKFGDVALQARRRSPDVVIIDELRTTEQVKEAVMIADTAHFVVAGFSAIDEQDAIARLIDAVGFYEKPAFRRALADNLVAVVTTYARPAERAWGRSALVVDAEMRESIRTGIEPARLANARAGHPPLGHEFWGVAGHPDDDECTHREDGTDATYCGLSADEHAFSGEERDALLYDVDHGIGHHPPLTRAEFEPGATVVNGIAFHDTDDAVMFSWGHVDETAYAEVVDAYSDMTGTRDTDASPAADLVNIRHVWAVNTRPVDSVAGWFLRWDGAITERTPGAFAITLAEH